MGNNCSRFSNATPFTIKIQVFQDEKRVTKWNEKFHVNNQLNLNVKGAIGPATAEASNKLEVDYQTMKEGTVYYADPHQTGYLNLPPFSSEKWEAPVADKNYLSAYVCLKTNNGKDSLVPLCEGMPVGNPVRRIFGLRPSRNKTAKVLDPSTDILMTHMAPEPKTWRINGDSAGSARANYFEPYVCLHCHRADKCKNDCSDFKEFGGLGGA